MWKIPKRLKIKQHAFNLLLEAQRGNLKGYLKILVLNENKNKTYQHSWNAAKAVFRWKVIALNTYI